jgi:hypothetical protein
MSYITALPLWLYTSSPRMPAGVMRPLPWVSIQFMAADGPACSTWPLGAGNSHMWLSARKAKSGSLPKAASTGTPVRRCQPVAALQRSPCLLPRPPLHEPPSVNTEPSCVSVLAL